MVVRCDGECMLVGCDGEWLLRPMVSFRWVAELLFRNVQRFLGGLVCKARRLVYHLTLGLREIKKKQTKADDCQLYRGERAG